MQLQLYSFIHADLIFPSIFCLKQYAIGLQLNHFRHKKYTIPRLTLSCRTWLLFFPSVSLWNPFCFGCCLPMQGPEDPTHHPLTTGSQHISSVLPRSLSRSLCSFLSYPYPYPSLSFSYANVLSCSQKNPCSTSCCRSRLAGCLISCRSSCFSSFSSCFCSSFPSSSMSDSHLTHFTSLVLSHF